MVYIKTDRPFVYGDFVFGPRRTGLPPPPGMQPFAIQILREFSTNEFIGKLFTRGPGGTWIPASSYGLSGYRWYEMFAKVRRHLVFEMEGSGRWAVEYFREESDESGPYLAIALKYAP
jgi:hypothetical protein